MNEQDSGSWWEFDPGEKPIPLDGDGWKVADDAEMIVNSHREAIGREDTDPTLETLARLRSQAGPPRQISLPKPAIRAAIGLLVVGCAAMFALGWVQGSATSEDAPSAMRGLSDRSAAVTQVTAASSQRVSLLDGLELAWKPRRVGRR